MDRETIENVLNAVSPSCKEEMEVALTSPSEISERWLVIFRYAVVLTRTMSSCKAEIQTALSRKIDPHGGFVEEPVPGKPTPQF